LVDAVLPKQLDDDVLKHVDGAEGEPEEEEVVLTDVDDHAYLNKARSISVSVCVYE